MIGRTISHYRVESRIGAGGMGIVYKAEDIRLKPTVALKFVSQDLTSDPDAKDRLVHEAQAASALDHPNIHTIHEIDTARPLLTMKSKKAGFSKSADFDVTVSRVRTATGC